MDTSTCAFLAQITATILIASSVGGLPQQYTKFGRAGKVGLFLLQVLVPVISIFVGANAAAQDGLDYPFAYIMFLGLGVSLGAFITTTYIRFTFTEDEDRRDRGDRDT